MLLFQTVHFIADVAEVRDEEVQVSNSLFALLCFACDRACLIIWNKKPIDYTSEILWETILM